MDWGGVVAGQVQGDQEKAAVTVQVGRDGGQGQVEGRGGHTLQPASALLIIASREGKAGSLDRKSTRLNSSH